MVDDREKWIKGVFESLEGMEKAVPDVKLYSKIEEDLFDGEVHVISFQSLRIAAVAAVILITLNILVLQQYKDTTAQNQQDIPYYESNHHGLVSNYKIYE